MKLFNRNSALDREFLNLAAADPELKILVGNLVRRAEKWKKLPKGWTEDSVKKFWESLTGDVKHKVTKCIKEIEGTDITDPGAFCAALTDRVDPGWRSRRANTEDRIPEEGDVVDHVAVFPDTGVAEIHFSSGKYVTVPLKRDIVMNVVARWVKTAKYITVTPAYGRDYRSKTEAVKDWNDGKDFILQDAASPWDGRPINKEDAKRIPGIRGVQIRYRKNTQVAIVKMG